MSALGLEPMPLTVAPVRERGLKSYPVFSPPYTYSRSREGAWIEIFYTLHGRFAVYVAPVRERGLKLLLVALLRPLTVSRSREGAWIEMLLLDYMERVVSSLP